MPKLINCSRCGEITEELTINKKTIKNCRKCREAHNNKIKQNKAKQETLSNTTQEEDTPQEETPQEQPAQEETPQEETPQEQPAQEEPTQEETPQEEAPQEEEPKPIKTMLKEIITNIKELTEIIYIQHDTTTDILNNINIKLDNTLNNINKTTTTQPSEADINEFIKKQQIQNKILTNKLDCIIKAIT